MQRELCGKKERAHPAHDDGQRIARCWDDEQQVSIPTPTLNRSKIRTRPQTFRLDENRVYIIFCILFLTNIPRCDV